MDLNIEAREDKEKKAKDKVFWKRLVLLKVRFYIVIFCIMMYIAMSSTQADLIGKFGEKAAEIIPAIFLFFGVCTSMEMLYAGLSFFWYYYNEYKSRADDERILVHHDYLDV